MILFVNISRCVCVYRLFSSPSANIGVCPLAIDMKKHNKEEIFDSVIPSESPSCFKEIYKIYPVKM